MRHRDVGHSERGKDHRVLVRIGVGRGWRVSQSRSGGGQDDVMRRGSSPTDLFNKG